MEITLDKKKIADLIADTLVQPLDLMSYALSRWLNGLFPEQAVVQGSEGAFDLNGFVAGGHCSVAPRPDLFHQFVVSFRGLNEGLRDEAQNVWYEVTWQGKRLQVVLVTWFESGCSSGHYWIIAETEALAREFYLRVCEWASEVRGEVLVFDNGNWYKDETLYRAIKNATFANLILPARLKQEIQDDLAQFFASRAVYERYRIPWKRGVLLLGPPGNGKTHTVKALINWLGAPCLYVKSFKSRYSTDQSNIQSVFYRARQTTPCILVMEDLDSLINDRNRSFFLNELDGFASNTGIVVLATTNHPERLDPALIHRPSRFDRKYHFELPAETERYHYIYAWNESLEPEMKITDFTIADIVATTEGFSFAYLKELFLSSMMRWISHSEQAGMGAVLAGQCVLLREQMHTMDEAAPAETETETEEYEE